MSTRRSFFVLLLLIIALGNGWHIENEKILFDTVYVVEAGKEIFKIIKCETEDAVQLAEGEEVWEVEQEWGGGYSVDYYLIGKIWVDDYETGSDIDFCLLDADQYEIYKSGEGLKESVIKKIRGGNITITPKKQSHHLALKTRYYLILSNMHGQKAKRVRIFLIARFEGCHG